ncbi:MAG: response regulator [Planctomycetota bacterium]|nr:response regulator [Planctomycetota bacterium]MDA1160552.1 response regulator [Planctomycetota bacterium]
MQPRIAIIDDDEHVRFSVGVLFEVSGFDVESFESAEEFLGHRDFCRFACLIIDFRLPGLNGLEFLRVLRDQNVLAPAVISSGFISESDEADFIAKGAIKVLHKPVEAKFLVSTINDIIARESPFVPSSREVS